MSGFSTSIITAEMLLSFKKIKYGYPSFPFGFYQPLLLSVAIIINNKMHTNTFVHVYEAALSIICVVGGASKNFVYYFINQVSGNIPWHIKPVY